MVHEPAFSWIASAVLLTIGGWACILNWVYLWKWWRHGEHNSTIPVLGGASVFIGILVMPIGDGRLYWLWVPLVADNTIVCLLYLPVFFYRRWRRKGGE
jgi:hypothetical protein